MCIIHLLIVTTKQKVVQNETCAGSYLHTKPDCSCERKTSIIWPINIFIMCDLVMGYWCILVIKQCIGAYFACVIILGLLPMKIQLNKNIVNLLTS